MTNGEVFYPRVTHQISGNTTGTTANISSGTYVLAAGNNVTLSQNGNSVTIVGGASGGGDGGNFIAAGTQTAGSTASVVFSNSNGISFGMSNSSIVTASHNGLTSQSNQAFSASGGSSAFQTLVFSNSNGFTFSNNAGSVVGSYTVPSTAGLISNINLSAGTTSNNLSALTFANSNGLTFGLNASTITASHNGLTSQSNQALSAANGSFTFQTASFADSNGVSFSTGTQGIFATVKTDYLTSQSNQAFSASGGSSAFQTLNFANSNGLTFSNSAGSVIASYTVPSTAGLLSAVNLSAGTTSNNLSAFTLSNSNSISFGLNGSVITASYGGLSSQSNQALSGSNGSFTFQTATFGNLNGLSFYSSNGSMVGSYTVPTVPAVGSISAGTTSATLGQVIFSNSNSVSFGMNAGTVTATVSYPAQTNQTVGFYASSQTAGASSSSTFDARSMTFRGMGIASVGASAGEIIISVPAGGGVGDGYNILAAGTQTANTTGTVSFANSNGVTFGMSNNSIITASVNAGGGGAAISGGTQSVSSGTVIFSNSNGVSFGMSGSQTMTVSVSGLNVYQSYDAYGPSPLVAGQQGQSTLHIQPYIMPSHQYDRIVLPMVMSNATNSSGSQSITFHVGIYTKNGSTLSLASSTSSGVGITQSGTAGSYSSYGGFRNFTIGSTNTIPAGMYWIGVLSMTTSGGANASFSQMLVSQVNSNHSGVFGVASATNAQVTLGHGILSAQTAAMPASIAFSNIRGTASLNQRQPAIYFLSQTS